MQHVKPPRLQRYQNYLPTAFDSSLTMLQKVNLMIKFMQDITLDFNEVVDFANEFDDKLKSKEDSVNIARNRKLSPNGNFTGMLDGKPIPIVLSEINTNTEKLAQLAWQFSDGYTGQVIDCGWFDSDNVVRSFDGGVF